MYNTRFKGIKIVPTLFFESFASLEKGIQMIAHGALILKSEIKRLRKANETLSK
jgi:hypothetical protein